MLLEAGADINVLGELKRPLLHYTAGSLFHRSGCRKQVDIAKMLLDKGLDVKESIKRAILRCMRLLVMSAQHSLLCFWREMQMLMR